MEIYYKTQLTIEVLSEKSITNWPLNVVIRECDAGELVLNSIGVKEQIRTPEEMTRDLEDAGSDPAFFGLVEM